jgi:hypothetical protein
MFKKFFMFKKTTPLCNDAKVKEHEEKFVMMAKEIKELHEKLDNMTATINGDEDWFLTVNRGSDHAKPKIT